MRLTLLCRKVHVAFTAILAGELLRGWGESTSASSGPEEVSVCVRGSRILHRTPEWEWVPKLLATSAPPPGNIP